VFNIDIYALKSRLAENTGFKASVFKELPDKIDLKKATRSYLGAISSIQAEVRRITRNAVESSRSVIEKYLEKYAELNNGNSFAIGAYNAASHKLGVKPVMLLLEWDDVRVELSEKNQSISNMEKRHVSSAITKK
jgi:vacuolar-type H+-ATPase subunit E/Vma4